MSDRYKSQPVCIATKHGKEGVIARPLLHALGLNTTTPPELDTDGFWHFAERKGTRGEVS